MHLLNGLYDCDRNGAPVFAIVTHIPSPEIGTDYFQETRPELIFADCTRYVGYITSPAQMPRLAELALEAAVLERGVGMVILPGDVGVMEVDHPTGGRPLAKARPKIRPMDADLDRLAERIAASRRPMIFGGEGCRDARAEVLQLAQLLQAPVGYTYRGKDVLEADNPNAVGMTGLLGWGGAYQALAECDLLLLLGTDFPYREFLATDATIVQIDDDPAHLGRRAKVDQGLVGDIGDTLRCLLPRLAQRDDRAFLDAVLEGHHEAVERIGTYVTHEGSGQGLRPEMVATAISDLAADDAVFTNDTGMCNVWGARYLRMKPGQRLLASFRHGSMANALPQAIGATIGSPDRQVVALCGDGGFSMLMGELLTLGGLGLTRKGHAVQQFDTRDGPDRDGRRRLHPIRHGRSQSGLWRGRARRRDPRRAGGACRGRSTRDRARVRARRAGAYRLRHGPAGTLDAAEDDRLAGRGHGPCDDEARIRRRQRRGGRNDQVKRAEHPASPLTHEVMAQADLRSDPRALIWTVGHGTRATESLADLLRAAGVTTVIDVRRYPEGRRQPHLSRKRLELDLPRLDLRYEWWGEALGGRRPAPPASATPSPWRSPGFAAYAAYMLTDVFRSALSTLEGRAVAGEALAVMCAETLWWRCHRRLIADALVSDGFEVRHLIDQPPGLVHRTSTHSVDKTRTHEQTGPARRTRPPAVHEAPRSRRWK